MTCQAPKFKIYIDCGKSSRRKKSKWTNDTEANSGLEIELFRLLRTSHEIIKYGLT